MWGRLQQVEWWAVLWLAPVDLLRVEQQLLSLAVVLQEHLQLQAVPVGLLQVGLPAQALLAAALAL